MIITWKIENIAAILNPDEIAARQASGPVVVQAVWRVSATDRIYQGSVSGRQAFEDMVRQQIAQQMTAPIVLPLPWHQPAQDSTEPPFGNDTPIGGNGNDSLGGL